MKTVAHNADVFQFRTELQLHAKAIHPNIVEFHCAFRYFETTYVMMELCSNGSLSEMVKGRGSISLPEARRFLVQICGAVKYLHHRDIIHRDLKLGNIFLDADMNIKLGDFGLAALLISENEADKGRRSTLCGTPNYVAPEVIDKKSYGGHNEKVDIWAIGIILWVILSARNHTLLTA